MGTSIEVYAMRFLSGVRNFQRLNILSITQFHKKPIAKPLHSLK